MARDHGRLVEPVHLDESEDLIGPDERIVGRIGARLVKRLERLAHVARVQELHAALVELLGLGRVLACRRLVVKRPGREAAEEHDGRVANLVLTTRLRRRCLLHSCCRLQASRGRRRRRRRLRLDLKARCFHTCWAC